MIDLVSQLLFIEVVILKEYKYSRKIMKKHFNKNLTMTEKEQCLFQQSSTCWICKKTY